MGALKKSDMPMAQKPEKSKASNEIQKAEIERLKKLLSEKIKDPNLAKKAAMIITEMLNK